MKTMVKAGIHLFYWIFSCLLIFSIIRVSFALSSPDTIIIRLNILGILLSALGFYSGYAYLFPRYLAKQQVRKVIWISILLSVCIGIFGVFITSAVILPYLDVQAAILLLCICSLLSLLHVITGCFIKGFITWYADIRYKEALEKKNLQTELALLKAQINPHFLFNTLNNIDVLIEKEPLKASVYLKKLSDILRFLLYENATEQVLLTEELSYIEKYIELQKLRTSNTNFVRYEVVGNPEGLQIAPMVFIPFIENAFKHAADKKIDKGVDIHVFIGIKEILFSCINTIREEASVVQKGNGLGEGLIKSRLELYYRENYRLDIVRSEDKYAVQLKLLLHDN